MRTENISTDSNTDGIRAVVSNRKVRTPLIEGAYTEILHEHYKVRAYLSEGMGVKPPKQIKYDDGMIGAEPEDNSRYVFELQRIAQKYPLASQQVATITAFVALAARISQVESIIFHDANGTFDKPNLIAAYEHFLDTDDGEVEQQKDGFWQAVVKAIRQIDRPIVPVEQRPIVALTEVEKNDPLSDPPINVGSTKPISDSTPTRKSA